MGNIAGFDQISKKSKKSPKNRRKKSSLDTISVQKCVLSQLKTEFHPFDTFFDVFLCFYVKKRMGCSKDVPRTKKTQKKRRKIVKRVKNRLHLTHPTYFRRNCVQRRLFSSIFWGFFDFFFGKRFFSENRTFRLRTKNRFLTIFFNFFYILGYVEGEFRPTGPRYVILGAGFARGCPGNGRMLKK